MSFVNGSQLHPEVISGGSVLGFFRVGIFFFYLRGETSLCFEGGRIKKKQNTGSHSPGELSSKGI